MAADFPVSIPSIPRVTAQTKRNAPGYEGDVLHNRLAEEVEALAAAVGVTGSAVSGSVEHRLTGAMSDISEHLLSPAPHSGNTIPLSRRRGGIFCDWGSYLGALTLASANTAEAVALDTAVLFDGYPAVKCTLSTTNAATYIARWTPTNTISLKNFVNIQVPFRMTGVDSTCSHGLQIWLKCASGKQARLVPIHTRTLPGEWRVDTWVRTTLSGTVSFTNTSNWDFLDSEQINAIDIVATSQVASNPYPFWLGPLRANATGDKGVLSIRLDGEYSSQSSIILPLLEAAGLTASLALTHADIGTAGRMSIGQIDAAYDAGHEVILHTYDSTKVNGYANATDWPSGYQITNDIMTGFAAAAAQGWTRGMGTLVEGFSGNYFTATSSATRQKLLKAALSAAGVETFLEITSSTMLNATSGPVGYSSPVVHCQKSIGSTDTPATVKTVIDSAIAGKEWAVLVMHEAVADGVTPVGNQMTASDIENWVSYLASVVAAGNLHVMPVKQAFRSIHG